MKNRYLTIILSSASFIILLVILILLSNSKSSSKRPNAVNTETDISSTETVKKTENNTTNSETTSPSTDITNENHVIETPEIEIEPVEKVISFIAAGDNIIHQAVMDDAKRIASETNSEKAYVFDSMYENILDEIQSADISFINQEGPIAGSSFGYTGYPNFNAPNEAGEALVRVGFDIVNIANNHMLDKGEAGYKNSINFWKTQPVTLVGGYESEEDFNTIRYYERDGLKIALISYTYGTNGYYLPLNSTMWVPYYNENDILNKHAKEARQNADIVIAMMHWGDENSFTPNAIQKKNCEILVNNNVDVIIGTHPHVLQPIEWKNRPDGKKTLVAYSIGNLLSTMHYSKNMVGGLLKFNIKYTSNEDVRIEDVELVPTMCYYSKNRTHLKLYKFSDFTKDLYTQHGSTLQENVSFDSVVGYVKNTISEEFLNKEFLTSVEAQN